MAEQKPPLAPEHDSPAHSKNTTTEEGESPMLKKDVYVVNITEAGPGNARVVLREGDPPEGANPPQGGDQGPIRDYALVLPAADVPAWGEKLTLKLSLRHG